MRNINFVVFMLISVVAFAQIPVEYNHTPNGEIVLGNYYTYFNGDYEGAVINLEADLEMYEKGVFLLKNEQKLKKAYIKFEPKRISLKTDTLKNKLAIIEKINTSDLEYVKMGIDSFFVVNKIINKEKIITKPNLVQHIAVIDSLRYALYHKFSFNGNLIEKFFISKTENDKTWKRVELKGEPKNNFLSLFQSLNRFIDKKELSIDDFLNSIKIVNYHKKFKNKEPLYFDSIWRELEKAEDAKYKAVISSEKDSIFTLKIFNKDPIIQVSISSLNPYKRTGETIKYDKKGKVIEERIYSNDSLKQATYFDDLGKSILKYKNVKYLNKYNQEAVKKVFDDDINVSYLNSLNKNIDINFKIEKSQISEAAYKEGNHKVQFYLKKDKQLKISKFETALRNYLYNTPEFKKKRLTSNLEGTILLDIKTDYKGRVVDYKILNKLDSDMDSYLESFCLKKFVKSSSNRFKFSGIKLENKQDLCRFLLPVTFEHKRFYKTFSRPNYWNNNMFMHQQMMQFQQQQFNVPTGF